MSQPAPAKPKDFSYLDQTEFRTKYASGPGLEKMRFYVGGIRCGKCVRKLEDMPLNLDGLRRLQVEMGKNLAHVEVDPSVLSFAQVASRIAELGFDPIPLTRELGFEDQQKKEDRNELVRLGVAAACAGNIMTFAFATYLGASLDWSPLFAWLSFVLYIPVVTYVAWPFYQGAWNSLRQRQISIDLPMAVASLSGFVFSVVQLLRGRDDIYFDSLSGFLFLILLSRFTQKRLQRGYLRPQEINESLQLQRVRRIESTGWTWRALDALRTGDRFLMQAPETLPAEAELLSAKAYFSMAWLSGESAAKTFLRGAVVPAGARLVSGEAQLKALKPLSETGFGQILEEVQKFSLSKNKIVITSDRWAQWLLGIVFTVALVFLAAYWHVSPEAAIQRSLALIILACPCAMAFGTPLALAAGLRRAQRRGLVVRDANVFETASRVRTVFFDKTGTLTDTDLSLRGNPDDVPSVYQKIILSLENESLHPIAFAFRKAFNAPAKLPPVEGFREIAGTGVSGFIYGRLYELKRQTTNTDTGVTSCQLYEDDKPILTFEFEARLKPDSASTLSELRARGLSVRLLSGDKSSAVEPLARFLRIKPEDVMHSLTPAQKAEVVAQSSSAMMVGDGINDSLALMRADVGVAVSGGVEAALKSAQVYIGEPGLAGVADLLDVSRSTMTLIRQNLFISIVYNIAGGTLALMGLVNPFVAAVLMPVSSGFILLSTWIRGRA